MARHKCDWCDGITELKDHVSPHLDRLAKDEVGSKHPLAYRVLYGLAQLIGTVAARHKVIQPKISWTETSIGIALFLFCGMAPILFPICRSSDRDPDFPVKLFTGGFAIWTLLTGFVVAAKLRQWRIFRRIGAD